MNEMHVHTSDTPKNVLVESGAEVRVYKKNRNGEGWEHCGRMSAYGPVMEGERMMLTNLDGGKDLNTSPIESSERTDGEIVVWTRNSTYTLKVARDMEKERLASWSPQKLLAAFGEKIQRTLRGY